MPFSNFKVVQVLRSLFVAGMATLSVAGCTPQQLYDSNQGWQRNECGRIPDHTEYERCMSKANTSYEDYKREAEANDRK